MRAKIQLTIVIVILFQSMGIAFTKIKPKDNHEVIIRNEDGTVRAWISTDITKIKLKNDRLYCGFYQGGLFCKQGMLQGKPLNGEFCKYDSRENIIESGNYKYGLKDGLWKYLSREGFLNETCEYRNGILHGVKTIYKDGKPDMTEKYKKGVLIGKPRSVDNRTGNKKYILNMRWIKNTKSKKAPSSPR